MSHSVPSFVQVHRLQVVKVRRKLWIDRASWMQLCVFLVDAYVILYDVL
jgi:hypothetical protein